MSVWHIKLTKVNYKANGINFAKQRLYNLKLFKMKIKPLGERVIIAPQEAETTTASGIIIPDTAKEKPMQGLVMATGKTADGKDLEVKVDDAVLYGRFAGTEIELEGKKYLIMEQSEILAVL